MSRFISFVSACLLSLICMSFNQASAAYVTNFDSGYVAGPLNGQNGWVNAANAGMNIDLSAGNPGAAAVNPNASNNGSYVLHGVPLVNGQTYRFEVDALITEGASAFVGLGWTSTYLAMGAWNSQGSSDGFRLESTVGQNQNLGIGLTEQWYHMSFDWTIGGSATMTVLDSTSTQIYQTTLNVAALDYTNASLGELVLYSNGLGTAAGTKFDNISFGVVPEPASIVLVGIGLGVCAFSAFRRRKMLNN